MALYGEKFRFYWEDGDPYFVTPAGKIIRLEVEDYIPYFVFGGSRAVPAVPCARGTKFKEDLVPGGLKRWTHVQLNSRD